VAERARYLFQICQDCEERFCICPACSAPVTPHFMVHVQFTSMIITSTSEFTSMIIKFTSEFTSMIITSISKILG